tara:strand:- start:2479 stop:2697 length:219 start_codon:yes stop_codon:yes gene_type:complete
MSKTPINGVPNGKKYRNWDEICEWLNGKPGREYKTSFLTVNSANVRKHNLNKEWNNLDVTVTGNTLTVRIAK